MVRLWNLCGAAVGGHSDFHSLGVHHGRKKKLDSHKG